MVRLQLRPRIRREEQATDELTRGLITVTNPGDVASEAYRTLRTNLLYTVVDDPPKAIVVTSPGPSEGKSTACANLGVVLAQADKSTLIVDCDLRKPSQHKIFGLRNLRGIVNVLVREANLHGVWQDSPVSKLKVVTGGPLPPDPTELLGTRRFAEFLNQVRQEFDYVLLDTPPIQLFSDSIVLASQGDGVLLVFDSQNTRKSAVRQSIHSLKAVRANVLGTMMNKTVAASNAGQYYGGYA